VSTGFGDIMPYKDPAKKREKQKEYSKKYYELNKDKVLASSGKSRRTKRAEFANFKSRLSCTKCGENHPAALDFHHVIPNPANAKITDLLRAGRFSFAMEEIMNKCVVLCSNCHRKHHYEEDKRKGA
jgi:hypothetical protein